MPKQLKQLAEMIDEPLYIVGGFVRNQLCGLPVDGCDIDICGAFDGEIFARLGAKSVPINKTLGTAKIVYKGQSFEYTRFRTEVYPAGGAHTPQKVEFSQSLAADANRRDFTANSIYFDIKNGQIVDPLGGADDVKNKVLKSGNPAAVFADDGLRLMRLVRFAAELGFEIESETKAAALAFKDNLKDIAGERKRDELNKILCADLRYGIEGAHYRGMKLLTELSLWQYILPSMTKMQIPQNPRYHKFDVLEHTFLAVKFAPPAVRLAALMHDVGKPLAQEKQGNMHGHAELSAEIAQKELGQSGLKYSRETVKEVAALCRLHMYDLNCLTGESKMRLFVAENFELIDKLQALAVADGMATGQNNLYVPRFTYFKELLLKENAPITVGDLEIDGKDVVAAGYQGVEISQKLLELWRECFFNPALNNRERLLKRLKKE